jgi:hypothetical protein
MKRLLILVLFLSLGTTAFADSPQYGRIVAIKKSISSYTKSYVANTPVLEDVTTYTITLQVGDSLVVGTYDLSPQQPEPPPDWGKGYPVKVQQERDSMSLQSPTGKLKLHIKKRKTGSSMEPLTAEEKNRLEELNAPVQSLIGLAPDANARSGSTKGAAEAFPGAAPPTPATPTGSVSVRSTPYLAEIFVDGDSMGYTPAKIALPPGKYTFRLEKAGYKAWTKEMMITVGSELTLDASLERK